MSTVAEVLAGSARWAVEQGEAPAAIESLPADSIDLCIFSPPYVDARLYLENGKDLGIARTPDQWVAWMFGVMAACSRVCRGLAACVCEGKTEDRRYDCTPLLLAADLHRAGYHLRKPCIYYRFSVPGSGSTDWWRNDYEPIICLARPGMLPWSDNTATGHPPKWGPGGEMSNRMSDGTRVNQWGRCGGHETGGTRGKAGRRQRKSRPSHEEPQSLAERNEATPGLFEPDADGSRDAFGCTPTSSRRRTGTGRSEKMGERKTLTGPGGKKKKVRAHTTTGPDGSVVCDDATYHPPPLANPGNVLKATYDALQVRQLYEGCVAGDLGPSDVIRCLVGGGQMGSKLAHDNEAPYPESLVTPFILSFCPPGGIVLDPFSGSGTTGAVAVRHGRRFIGFDLRESQVQLSRRRIAAETPTLFGKEAS